MILPKNSKTQQTANDRTRDLQASLGSQIDINSPLSSFQSPTSTQTITFRDLPSIAFGLFNFPFGVIQDVKIDEKKALVKHAIPYNSADLVEDLGKSSSQISMSVVYSNGVDPLAYPYGYQQLLKTRDLALPEYLTFPDGTQYYCYLADIQTTYTPKQRDGIVCMVHFIETLNITNISAPQIISTKLPTYKKPDVKTLKAFKDFQPSDIDTVSDIDKTLNQISGALSQGIILLDLAQAEFDMYIGKITKVLDMINLLDDRLHGIFADLRYYLNEILFLAYQKKFSENLGATTATIDIYLCKSQTSINEICRRFNMDLQKFYALNPWHIGKISLDIEDVVKYQKTGNQK